MHTDGFLLGVGSNEGENNEEREQVLCILIKSFMKSLCMVVFFLSAFFVDAKQCNEKTLNI